MAEAILRSGLPSVLPSQNEDAPACASMRKGRHQVGLGLVGLVEHGFPDVVNGWVTRLTALQASYGPADWHNPCDTVWSTPTTRSTPWPKPS
jgi:hypothetical protein